MWSLMVKTNDNIKSVRLAFNEDYRLTLRKLENNLELAQRNDWNIATENFQMTCFIPKLLTNEQKDC